MIEAKDFVVELFGFLRWDAEEAAAATAAESTADATAPTADGLLRVAVSRTTASARATAGPGAARTAELRDDRHAGEGFRHFQANGLIRSICDNEPGRVVIHDDQFDGNLAGVDGVEEIAVRRIDRRCSCLCGLRRGWGVVG